MTFYSLISLLPVFSKLFEKLLLKRIKPSLKENNIVPQHQFGFREQHSTIQQIYCVINIIESSLEERTICSSAFVDISQAFDEVWQTGLLYKIKLALSHNFYVLLKSYLNETYFYVSINENE